jgi:hypothetical protein
LADGCASMSCCHTQGVMGNQHQPRRVSSDTTCWACSNSASSHPCRAVQGREEGAAPHLTHRHHNSVLSQLTERVSCILRVGAHDHNLGQRVLHSYKQEVARLSTDRVRHAVPRGLATAVGTVTIAESEPGLLSGTPTCMLAMAMPKSSACSHVPRCFAGPTYWGVGCKSSDRPEYHDQWCWRSAG